MDRKDSLQGVFAQAAVGIASCSLDGTILLANERLGEILGSSTGDLLQRTLPSVLHPDETARASDLFARVAEPNFASCTFETRSVKSAWISATISPVRNSGGVIEGIAVVVHDIDDRKDTEAAYRRTAEQIERLYRISNAVIRAEDVSHIFELALEGLQEALGADRAAVLLYENDGVMRFKAWSGLTDDYRAMAEGHSPWAKDARDPQPVLVADVALDPGLEALRDRILEYGIRSLAFVPLVYNDQLLGKLMIYYNASHSFTPDEVQVAQTVANHVAFAISRKLAEERLLLYQQIVQKSIDGIAILDGEGKYLEQNKAHEELLGYSSEELAGKTPAIHFGEEAFAHMVQELQATGVYRGEAISRARDGHTVNIELSAFAVRDAASKPVCYVGIKRDVSERKQAEAKLRESEERFRVMADTAPVLLWVADTEGKCTWFNRPWLAFTGKPIEQELGYGWCDGLHPDDLTAIRRAFHNAYAERQPTEMEYRLRRADGEFRWILDHGVPRFDLDGEFVGYVGSCKDITDRKRAQQAIERANVLLEQRVAERTSELTSANQELEGFTYSVSHDLRGPLRAITATSRILMEECSDKLSNEHVEMLTRQAENATRLGTLIDDLLKLSRLARQEIVRTHVDLTAIAQEVAEDLATRDQCSPVTFEIEPNMAASADEKLIRFVLLNLMENACKFSPDGGVVHVGTRGDAFFVKDSGIGFDMEYLPKVFLPFERLVRDDQFPGTGIGLANVKRIVERHRGRVWAESKPGEGSVFFFTIL